MIEFSPNQLLGLKGFSEVASGFAGFIGDSRKAKAEKAWQKYRNKMVDLSASINQNALTTNELLAQDAFAAQAIELDKSTILTRARTEVAAAAAGVKGKSVNRSIRRIIATSAEREAERQAEFSAMKSGIRQQRLNTSLSAAMQQDYSVIPKPSPVSYILGAVGNTIDFGYKTGLIS